MCNTWVIKQWAIACLYWLLLSSLLKLFPFIPFFSISLYASPETGVSGAGVSGASSGWCFISPEPDSISCSLWRSYRCNVSVRVRHSPWLFVACMAYWWQVKTYCCMHVIYNIHMLAGEKMKSMNYISLVAMTVRVSWKVECSQRYRCWDYTLWFSLCAFQTFKLQLLQRIKKRKYIPIFHLLLQCIAGGGCWLLSVEHC